ncbi:MAG: GerMN domain-containing protein [Peptococcaceae bacterium]|nr:GerMN domain-containing protein [Peptococcaceae bacterium]
MPKKIAAKIFLVTLILLSFVACHKLDSATDPDREGLDTENLDKDPSAAVVVLYLPNTTADGFVLKNAVTDGAAEHIIALLVREQALPEGCALKSFHSDAKSGVADMNGAFGQAIRQQGTAGEYLLLGSVVNTLLTFFQLDAVTLTIDGEVLESGHDVYDFPLCFFDDQISK